MPKFVFSNASNRTTGDRFIPNRSNANIEIAHFKLVSADKNKEKLKNDIFSLKPNQLIKYRELLQCTINYESSTIYSFKIAVNTPKIKENKSASNNCPQWPCIPRKYPVLRKPDIILDWPNVHPEIYWNIVDWSTTDYMATIWSDEVFLWRHKDNHCEEVIDTKIKAYGALRWNHAGTQLAVAGLVSSLTVWNLPEKKFLYTCKCYWQTCTISCIAWDLTDSLLVSGCTLGLLAKWGPEGKSLGCVQAHYGYRVVSLAFDASNKYLCSSGTDGLVRIWKWPQCDPHVEVEYCSPVRAIAFHPWRPAVLALGGGLGDGSLSIWNVNTCRRIGYIRPERNSLVDCLAWNHVTGELVSSHQLLTGTGFVLDGAKTKVLVLAGLDRVVDCVNELYGRVLYLMWDGTGTQLAMGCNDESLCIWNFLGHTSRTSETIIRRNKQLGQPKRSLLSNFEKCIR